MDMLLKKGLRIFTSMRDYLASEEESFFKFNVSKLL